MDPQFFVDIGILAWLVATWIIERREHRACCVRVVCKRCISETDVPCESRPKE